MNCNTTHYRANSSSVPGDPTGIIPTGEGLFAFADIDQAAAAIEQVESDYARHCAAARKVAAEYFDSAVVLRDILQHVGLDAHD